VCLMAERVLRLFDETDEFDEVLDWWAADVGRAPRVERRGEGIVYGLLLVRVMCW